MPFDSLTLSAVTREIGDALLRDRVQAVHQPDDRSVLLTFSRKRRLLLSSHPDYARLHLASHDWPRPQQPPVFCMLLRKYLEGARLVELRQPHFDRVLEMDFARGEDRVTLIAEIMGRHSNIILRASTGIILGVIKTVPSSVNRYRLVATGSAYIPPPIGDRVSPMEGSTSERVSDLITTQGDQSVGKALGAVWTGMSPILIAWLLEQAVIRSDEPCAAINSEQLEGALDRLRQIVLSGGFEPATGIVLGKSPRSTGAGGNRQEAEEPAQAAATERRDPEKAPTNVRAVRDIWALPFPTAMGVMEQSHGESISQLVEAVFEERERRQQEDALRAQITSALNAAVQRESRKLEDFSRVQEEAGKAEQMRRWAESLLAYAGEVPSGADRVGLNDVEGGVIDIPLDSEKSAIENAEAYFRRARDAERAARRIAEMAVGARKTVGEIQHRLIQVAAASTLDELRKIAGSIPPTWGAAIPGSSPTPSRQDSARAKAEPALPPGIRRQVAPSGHEILYGRSSSDNDYLTTRIARPNDWWLHVRGETSTHVIIRTNNQPDRVPRETLLEAANVAAIHGASKHSSYVAVDYTLRKYVVKRRGSPPGSVEYRGEKTLHVQPQLG